MNALVAIGIGIAVRMVYILIFARCKGFGERARDKENHLY